MTWRAPLLLAAFFATAVSANAEFNVQQVDEALRAGHWNDALEMCYEANRKDPRAEVPKFKGAYALFQRGYPNSALLLLKKLNPDDWKKFPQGQDRFSEVVALFQKKIPENILPGNLALVNSLEVAPYLRDEVNFAKGRQAFEMGDLKSAQALLETVSKNSRFYIGSKFLLGAIAIKKPDYTQASKEFSIVFEPGVFQQSSEFWNDMTAQMTDHWGANLKVWLDADFLTQSQRVGELALMGLARTAYAKRDFAIALATYNKVPQKAHSTARSQLEKIWTLLNLNKHDAAVETAKVLVVDENSFESLEARMAKAIVLTDAGRTAEARKEIDEFIRAYTAARRALLAFHQVPVNASLPAFVKTDLREDLQIQSLEAYSSGLISEVQSLRAENSQLFPVYSHLSLELEPLLSQAKTFMAKLTLDRVNDRIQDLEQLYVQAKLVTAETYLEDREQLREKFAGLGSANEAMQREHDQELLKTLNAAVSSVDEVMGRPEVHNPALEFRQSELLWELGVARDVAGIGDKKLAGAARETKVRALDVAKQVLRKYPNFNKRAQVMFFTGFAEMELGQIQQGLQDLKLYVNVNPKDEHVADAYRILGDNDFDLNHFAQAEAYYKKIVEFPDSPILGYALYKIAWCGYNQRDYAKALLGLEKAITLRQGNESSQMISLKREARHDLISIYAEVGDTRKAADYFKQFFSENESQWLKDLAIQLDKTGQYEKSRDMYRMLVALDAGAPEALTYRANIIEGAFQLHDWNLLISETDSLKVDYGEKLSKPSDAGKPVEEILRKAMLFQLFEYERTQTEEVGGRTMRLNKIYLSLFKNWPEAQDPLYRHAHFLIKHKDKALAAQAFEEHWLKHQTHLKEPTREEALRDLLYALKELEADVKDGGPQPSELAKKILQHSTDYQTAYAKDSHARAVAFIRAAILFKYQQWDQGMTESQKLFEINPIDDVGKRCFQNLRYAYYQKKDWTATYNWATAMAKRADTKTYSEELKTIREESMFLRADGTQDAAQAAQLYLQLAQDPAFARLKQKSLFNAFLRLQKSDNRLEAVHTANQLEKADPHFPGLHEIRGARAALYQEAGDYKRAWPLLKGFIREPNPGISAEIIKQAKLNTALIAEALGQNAEALAISKEFISRTPAGSAPVPAEAGRIVARLERKVEEVPRAWAPLMKEKKYFESAAFSRKGDLAGRIKNGATWLEELTKRFLRFAENKNVPLTYALEAYCMLPNLYRSFGDQVTYLGVKNPETRDEIAKITAPIYDKAADLANQCIAKSTEHGHNGESYRFAVENWGWATNPELKTKVTALVARLDARGPGLDPDPLNNTEEQVLETHLQSHESEASWYSLAIKRLNAGHVSMSRLTFVAAMTKWPASGRSQLAFAHIEEMHDADPTALYRQAAKNGAPRAWIALARYQLKRLQWDLARQSLKEAFQAKLFADDADLNRMVGELIR